MIVLNHHDTRLPNGLPDVGFPTTPRATLALSPTLGGRLGWLLGGFREHREHMPECSSQEPGFRLALLRGRAKPCICLKSCLSALALPALYCARLALFPSSRCLRAGRPIVAIDRPRAGPAPLFPTSPLGRSSHRLRQGFGQSVPRNWRVVAAAAVRRRGKLEHAPRVALSR